MLVGLCRFKLDLDTNNDQSNLVRINSTKVRKMIRYFNQVSDTNFSMSLYFKIKAEALETVTKLTHCPKCQIPADGKFCSECAQPLTVVSVKTIPGLELLKEGDFFFPRNEKGHYVCYIHTSSRNDIPAEHHDVIQHKKMIEMIKTLESHGIDFEVIFSY